MNSKFFILSKELYVFFSVSFMIFLFISFCFPVAAYLTVIAVLIFCSVSDIITMYVENICTFFLLCSGLPIFLFLNYKSAGLNIVFAIIILLFGTIINYKQPRMGGADIKILSVLCLFTGPMDCFYVFISGCIIACGYTLAVLLVTFFNDLPLFKIFHNTSYKKLKKEKARGNILKKEIPFVPFITAGYILTSLLY